MFQITLGALSQNIASQPKEGTINRPEHQGDGEGCPEAYFGKHSKNTTLSCISCDICGKAYRRKDNLICHMKMCHSEDQGHQECKICEKSFPTELHLNKHTRKSHTDTRYTCAIGSLTFKHKDSLTLHDASAHKRKFKMICQFCGRGFNIKTEYQSHIYRHKGLTPYQCSKCGDYFRAKYTLKCHFAGCGVIERNYNCKICQRSFKRPSYLKEHIRDIHENPRGIICVKCGKKFKCRSTYRHHQRRHHASQKAENKQ